MNKLIKLLLFTLMATSLTGYSHIFTVHNLTSKPYQIRFQLVGLSEPFYVFGNQWDKTKENYHNFTPADTAQTIRFEAGSDWEGLKLNWDKTDYARKFGFCLKFDSIQYRELGSDGKPSTDPMRPAWKPLDIKFIEPAHVTQITDAATSIGRALSGLVSAAGGAALGAAGVDTMIESLDLGAMIEGFMKVGGYTNCAGREFYLVEVPQITTHKKVIKDSEGNEEIVETKEPIWTGTLPTTTIMLLTKAE